MKGRCLAMKGILLYSTTVQIRFVSPSCYLRLGCTVSKVFFPSRPSRIWAFRGDFDEKTPSTRSPAGAGHSKSHFFFGWGSINLFFKNFVWPPRPSGRRRWTLAATSRIRFPSLPSWLVFSALPTRKSTLTGNEHSRSCGCLYTRNMLQSLEHEQSASASSSFKRLGSGRRFFEGRLDLPRK